MVEPADPVYPVVFFRHAASQIRDDGLVKNKAAYVAPALNPNGEKDVLWVWIEPPSSCRSLRTARAGGGRRL
jgi:transposase-like protein